MIILHPPAFIPTLENKYLLLDTNIFIDALLNLNPYSDFFIRIKEAHATIATIDLVKCEFLMGSASQEKYDEKERFFNSTIDSLLPSTLDITNNVYRLITEYGRDGGALQTTDMMLGAFLMKYRKDIYLMTRDTTDFIQRILKLQFVINAPHKKGIHTYGVYQYL